MAQPGTQLEQDEARIAGFVEQAIVTGSTGYVVSMPGEDSRLGLSGSVLDVSTPDGAVIRVHVETIVS